MSDGLVSRRHVLGALAAGSLAGPTWADDFPSRPIDWVVPYAAGGGSDLVARVLAEPMGAALGQPLVVNNKPGAATNIGAEYAARAKPDGYTVLTADTGTLAANPYLYSKLRYSAEQDFAPIGLMVRFPLLAVVNAKLPVKNWAEFSAWAKAQSAGVSFASPGAGSPHHLAAELLRHRSGLKLVHVAYKGAAPAVNDVISGQVPFMLVDTAVGTQYVQAGQLRALAVASLQRLPSFKDVPTLHELGFKGLEAFAWQGLVAPAATPVSRIARLSQALQAALANPAAAAKLQAMGLELTPGTPKDMATYARAERNKWRQVIEGSQIKLD
jgi:tripartite-type tricarboxylate transporter receptor subunit TctC